MKAKRGRREQKSDSPRIGKWLKRYNSKNGKAQCLSLWNESEQVIKKLKN